MTLYAIDTTAAFMTKTLEIPDIQALIPHRYPMLLIDRVEIQDADRGIGLKGVTFNEHFFQGHFPDKPVMPGVLIVEAMAQTAGIIVMNNAAQQNTKNLVYFMSIEEAKFRKPVLPGCLLELHVCKVQSRANVWKFSGKAMVKGQLHAEATFTAMISPNQ